MTDFPLAGLRVLVVEDETLVAMLLEDMLGDLGCEVVATASRIAHAVELARDPAQTFDAAILDVNVAGESITPVAQALSERPTPFVFATGYGESGVPEAFRGRPVLQKPFSIADVQIRLREAVAP